MGSWEHKHTILYYFFNRCVAVITFPEIGAHQNLPTSSISNSCVRIYVLFLNSLLNFILHFQRFYISQVDKNTNTLVLQIWLNFLKVTFGVALDRKGNNCHTSVEEIIQDGVFMLPAAHFISRTMNPIDPFNLL
jgi:hypothetical protein